jgi:hypothetical protein
MRARQALAPKTTTRRAFLGASAATAALAVAPLVGSAPAAADPSFGAGPGKPLLPQLPDRNLRQLLREIDSDRIEASVRRPVACPAPI